MRVATIIDSLGLGGAERSLVQLLPHIATHDVEPIVICLQRLHTPVEAAVTDAGIVVEYLRSSRFPAQAAEIAQLLAATQPAVVHVSLFQATMAAAPGARRQNLPSLCSLVNTTYDPVRRLDPAVRPWKLEASRVLDSLVSRNLVTHFHAVTQGVADAAVRDLGVTPERVTVVERGREASTFDAVTAEDARRCRQELGLADEDDVVLAVGRHEYQKGFGDLLDAVVKLQVGRPRLHLLIAGRDGNATCEVQARLGSLPDPGRVHLLGDRPDVAVLLAASDLYVLSSRYEGAAGAAVEAMAARRAIVATDVAGLTGVTRHDHNAWVVPVADPAAIAEAVGRLLDDPSTRSRLGTAARATFDARFTLDRSGAGMAELYHSLAVPSPRLAPAQTRRRGHPLVRTALDVTLGSLSPSTTRRAVGHRWLSVFTYHDLEDADRFREQMTWLVDHLHPVTPDLVAAAAAGDAPLPDDAALVTFDDGQRSVLEVAAPILRSLGVPAVAFVVTDVLGTTDPYWWEVAHQLRACGGTTSVGDHLGPDALVAHLKTVPEGTRRAAMAELAATASAPVAPRAHLDAADLRALRAHRIAIGNHTATHPLLDRCPSPQVVQEVVDAHDAITAATGVAPDLFAYPNGNRDARAIGVLRELGYRGAFVHDHHHEPLPIVDRWAIRRLRVASTDPMRRIRAVGNGLHPAFHQALGRA